MDSTEPPHQPSDERLTFTIKKSTRNVFFSKILILLVLTLLGGYFFARDGSQKYEKGRELTQEKYLERFDAYKGGLLSAKQYDNPLLSTFVMLIVVSFLIGSYELTALIIGFIIGKVVRR
jgi:predicted PurR-regulated permease PerM